MAAPGQHANVNSLLEVLGMWAPIMVVVTFAGEPRFADVVLDAYGSGSLAVAAAIIALTLLAGTANRFSVSVLIIAFVIIMFTLQVRVLDHYVYSIPPSANETRDAVSDLMKKVTPEIWISFVGFLSIAMIRTAVLRKQASLFNEDQ